jgi:predicted nucleic acid-binding protein
MPENLVIADTSCLILLNKIDELNILKDNYNKVYITPEIANEFNLEIPEWIEIIEVRNRTLQLLFQNSLDLGESTALSLAFEIPDSIVILDDLKARKVARNLGLKITGTIGVIVNAKLKGTIPSVKEILDKIIKTDFRINAKIINEAISAAGESP